MRRRWLNVVGGSLLPDPLDGIKPYKHECHTSPLFNKSSAHSGVDETNRFGSDQVVGRHHTHRMKSRIMYIEDKSDGLIGPARIGRVTFSKTGGTLYYQGRSFQRVRGFKHNYEDVNTGDPFWISGPKRNGEDSLYHSSIPTEIDDDVRGEYWRDIRQQPLD